MRSSVYLQECRWFRPRRQALGQVLRSERVTSAGVNRQAARLDKEEKRSDPMGIQPCEKNRQLF